MKPSLFHAWPLTRYADRTAFLFGQRRVTFREMEARINRLRHGLLRAGLKRGHRVAVLLNNCLEAVECLFGVPGVGVTFVPLNSRHSAGEHAYVLEDSETDTVILGSEFVPVLEPVLSRLPRVQRVIVVGKPQPGTLAYESLLSGQPEDEPDVEVDGEDIERIHYTSGTTGKPKGVVSTFRISYERVVSVLMNLDEPIRPDDVNLNIGPLPHATGFMMSIYYIRGATNVILAGFDPEEVLRTIERERVTSVLFIPTMLYRLLSLPGLRSYDLSSIRRIWYGTAPMAPEKLRAAMEVFGPVFRQNYGMTECPQPITYLEPKEHVLQGTAEQMRRLASAGKPALGVELRILKEDGSPVKPGEMGEIVLRTNKLFKEYWKRPEATAEALRGGWFHTGDMGTLDEEGYVFILDRKHDMIISGGFNIYPREVEDAINHHPAVQDVAVIGVPDDLWGEAVKAFVVPKGDGTLTEEEVIQFCKGRLAGYKKPKSVEFVRELPKNPYGKVLRRELKERYWKEMDRRVH